MKRLPDLALLSLSVGLVACLPPPPPPYAPARTSFEQDKTCATLLDRYHTFENAFYDRESGVDRRSLRDHVAVEAHACHLDAAFMQTWAPDWADTMATSIPEVYAAMLQTYAEQAGPELKLYDGMLTALHRLGHDEACDAVVAAVARLEPSPEDGTYERTNRNEWLGGIMTGCPDRPETLALARKSLAELAPVTRNKICAYLGLHGDSTDVPKLTLLASTDAAAVSVDAGVIYPVRDSCREAVGRIAMRDTSGR